MATEKRGGWFRRRSTTPRVPLRALTASAKKISLKEKPDARMMKALRQGWQSEAWNYRDMIGELRFALEFLANSTSRMKIHVAAYPQGGETDSPVPLAQVEGVPPELVQVCSQALLELGNGRLSLADLLGCASTQFSVAGEGWLLGRQNEDGSDEWSVRSVDEIDIKDDKWQLRELPAESGTGGWGYEPLDPETTVLARMWTPHPRFGMLADSSCRAILTDFENITILRRMIRATGKSRIAARGLLAIPEEFSLVQAGTEDDDDPQADDFTDELTQAMITPISDEGSASAVMPIILRGPGEMIGKIAHIDVASKFSEAEIKVRQEVIGVIASGLDLPKEVIEGLADLNHWSAWAVDDNTFRYHVEPHVINVVDALTAAYLRPRLEIAGLPAEAQSWINRCVLWYDPTELVTHPDRSADAKDAYDRHAISAPALRRELGFEDADAGQPAEEMIRLIQNMRNPPVNVVMAALHVLMPGLEIPAVTESGTIPGITRGGVDPAEAAEAAGDAPAVAAIPPATGTEAPPPTGPPAEPGVTAAGGRPARQGKTRLSRKLVEIDRDLRIRLVTAANALMGRELDKAGARLRAAVVNHKDETVKQVIARHRGRELPAALGRDAIVAAGVDPDALLAEDWTPLKDQFDRWTAAAQERAVKTALQIGELDDHSTAAAVARAAMADDRNAAWKVMENALTHIGHTLLYDPHPMVEDPLALASPDTLVPAGVIRAALGVAGGASQNDLGIDTKGNATIALGSEVGQVGTGTTVEALIKEAGGEVMEYEWVHGPALKPFEPHEALDGIQFGSFTDERLANNSDWPANSFFFPGDHEGCLCDFMPVWLSPSEAVEQGIEGDEAGADEPEGGG